MKTRLFKIKPSRPSASLIQAAARVLRAGGLVAFPTETVYGLGADALSSAAVLRIFRAKGRPADNPLIVHIADADDLHRLAAHVPETALKLVRRFWPGPLTIVLTKTDLVPKAVTAGLDTVAIRMPAHPVALALIRASGLPIAAPSANSSGKPSPTSAKHVLEDLEGRIGILLDGGPTRIGIESTVVDLTTRVPQILRPGKISAAQIRRCIGPVRSPKRSPRVKNPRSPGMKYRHYAPKARLILVEGSKPIVVRRIQSLIREHAGLSIAVLTTNRRRVYPGAHTVFIGSSANAIARHLFRVLREMDEHGVSLVLSEGVHVAGFGAAVMNRLRKAAENGGATDTSKHWKNSVKRR